MTDSTGGCGFWSESSVAVIVASWSSPAKMKKSKGERGRGLIRGCYGSGGGLVRFGLWFVTVEV